MLQVPLGGTVEQFVVAANWVEAVTPETIIVEFPVLVTVTTWGLLIDPTAVTPKVRADGVKVAVVT
jgi:hypothetical protein